MTTSIEAAVDPFAAAKVVLEYGSEDETKCQRCRVRTDPGAFQYGSGPRHDDA